MSRRSLPGLLLAACFVWLVGSCASRRPSVDVPVSSWPGYEYFYLAHELGFDRVEGIEIFPRQYPDPQSIVHAYLRAELPIAQLTTIELVELCARVPERCPVVILVLDESVEADQIISVPSLLSIRDLKGKSIAVSRSNFGPFVLGRALQLHGLSLSEIKMRKMELGLMPKALFTGSVDAAVLPSPSSRVTLRGAPLRPLFNSAVIPGEILTVLVVEKNFLKLNQNSVVSLLRSWSAAHAEARLSPQRALPLLAERERLSVDEFRAAEQGLRYFSLSDQVEMLQPEGRVARNIEAVRDLQEKLQLIPRGSIIPKVTSTYVEAAQ